ncbi:family 20 glycosylhydrolase [Streptomyces sp. NPDC059104]|uniref:family 20 glycosylhydrolase n=1 Tax=Streptomyces sp. NPDC059104 TaxID=3346729 RepID=UPI00369C902C
MSASAPCAWTSPSPGPYLSIGGDEAHATKASEYATFMSRVQQTVVDNGKTAVGWHQITGAALHPSTVVQYWGDSPTHPATAAAAAKGTGLIMSPAKRAYLDQKYDPRTVIGLTWAATIDVRTAYEWDPATCLSGAPASSIRGIEASLWSESVTTPQDIDYLTFPRLPAYAEPGWSPAPTRDFTGFARRLAAHGPRWDALGMRYHRSPQIPWPTDASDTGPAGPVSSGIAGKCLDVLGAGRTDGTPVVLYDCNSTPAQQRRWNAGQGAAVINPASGRCIDAPGATGTNRTQLQIWRLP